MNQKYQKLIPNTNDDEPLNKKIRATTKILVPLPKHKLYPLVFVFPRKRRSKDPFF
jgi:hypothetical protein